MDPEPWEAALKLWLRAEYDAKEGGLGVEAFRARLADLRLLVEAVDEAGAFARLPPGGVLLDGGTGSGVFLVGVLLRNPHLAGVGVDLSPGAVETAAATVSALGLPRARFETANLEALPHPAGFFGGALSACTLNLLPRRREGLQEIARTLAAGAPFVLLESFVPGAPANPGGPADPQRFAEEALACGLREETRRDVTGEVRRLCREGRWPWSSAIREESRFHVVGLRRTG
ncbi:MAG TPA: class I SAM-dependent methyltransferase [Candidatus Thermoplasmatota archaeon]|nr:class I SAM-dependent methyltransferase [Candidatus Thermoplasmatota archaeon]